MKALRARLSAVSQSDEGFTLIEVIVALMIFAIVAVGIGYSLTSVLVLTRDGRSREVAIGLAAESIDDARSIEDIFTIESQDPTDATDHTVRSVDGVDYYIVRVAKWVTSTNSDAQCGAAGGVTVGGSFEFKRINVTVTWNGMRPGSLPVRSDTLIAPNKRINEENKGTILVSVQLASGRGAAGLAVTATPASTNPNGAAAITVPILATDEEGCTYILKVVPGNYTITLTKLGWIDDGQNSPASKTISVAADGSTAVGFQFDQAATYKLNFGDATTALKPTNFNVSFTNTYGDKVVTNPAAGGTALHPFTVGYQAIAGDPNDAVPTNLGCESPDPANWPARAGDGALGIRSEAASAAPGATATVPIGMGMITVPNVNGSYITAVSEATGPNGDPGCAQQVKYFFGKMSTANPVIALPFGSWRIYKSSDSTLGSDMSGLLPVAPIGTVSGKVVTLDPRVVLP